MVWVMLEVCRHPVVILVGKGPYNSLNNLLSVDLYLDAIELVPENQDIWYEQKEVFITTIRLRTQKTSFCCNPYP